LSLPSRRVAVILVNYRNAEDTLACLRSLEATDHGGFAVHIVDNASGDGSAEAIGANLRGSPLAAVLHPAPGNLGYAGGVNVGMRAALADGAEFLLVMNNDVKVAADFGRELARACEAHPDAVVAGSIRHEATGRPAHNLGVISPATLRIRYLLEEYDGRPFDFVSGCLMLVPAKVARRVGLFDEKYFMYCEDLDYCLRLAEAGVPFACHPALSIRHKVNASVDKLGFAKEYYLIRNQTHISMTRGSPRQRLLYLASLLVVVLLKARQPRLFLAFLRAVRDALAGRLGRR
jgi:GT2 family glycosyltransferase